MTAIFSVLTSRIAAMVYAGLVVLLTVVYGVTLIQRNDARSQVATLTNTVGQLKGALDFQNQQVQQEADLAAEKQKAAESALQAATAARQKGVSAIAALRALPATVSPAKACIAGPDDDALLENLK